MHELEAAWFGKIRSSGLHNLDNWIKDLTIHISYVPTGFGAKGHEKCAKFFTAFPHSRHLLNADQLERLGGSIETVSVTVDEKRSRLVEEAIVRTVHYERIDWLAPGIEGTNRQIILPFIFIASFGNHGLLQSVHVYWEHASLLQQLGQLEASISAGRRHREANPLEIINEYLPIAKAGDQLVNGICNPTFNCNDLPQKKEQRSVGGAIGGLDSMGNLLTDLPLEQGQLPSTKQHPALHSKIFQETAEPIDNITSNVCSPAFKSHLIFSEEPNSTTVHTSIPRQRPVDNIFGECRTEEVISSKSIDPKRNQSSIFDMDISNSPFRPNLASLDFESRMRSNISMSDSSPQQKIVSNSMDFDCESRFNSRILTNEEQQPKVVLPKSTHNSSHIFDPETPPQKGEKRSLRQYISQICFGDEQSDSVPFAQVSTADEHFKQNTSRRHQNVNKSQFSFGDE